MVSFLTELANSMITVVRQDMYGFRVGLISTAVVFGFLFWLCNHTAWYVARHSTDGMVRQGTKWDKRNWVYMLVAIWYVPSLSTVMAILDEHMAAILVGFWLVLVPFPLLIASDRFGDMVVNMLCRIERVFWTVDDVLRGVLNIGRTIVRRFPLQFAVLALLVVFAGSLAPQPIQAEAEQIVTIEPAETKEEPYAPQTTVSGDRYVTELVTQSPIVSGRINDAYVVVETVGAPIAIRWIVQGRTAIIDVLSDEPVMIGFSGVGGADNSVQGTRQSYEHGKLFKLTIPSDWESPNITIGVHGEQGSTIMINWFPS